MQKATKFNKKLEACIIFLQAFIALDSAEIENLTNKYTYKRKKIHCSANILENKSFKITWDD